MPVKTDDGLEWWVFDDKGELVDAYWVEKKAKPQPASAIGIIISMVIVVGCFVLAR